MKVIPFPRPLAASRKGTTPVAAAAAPTGRISLEAWALAATLALVAGATTFGFWLGSLA